jgi:thiamine pyrophosphokinase
MKKCVIIASAPADDDDILKNIDAVNSFVICADGGLDIALRNGLIPNLIIGDFDSLQGALPDKIETIKLNMAKDDTDMMAAIKEGIQRGYRQFELYCALGGRFDHSFANFSALQYLTSQGCKAVIETKGCRVFLLTSGRLTLRKLKNSTLSVFPFGADYCTVSYEGMKFPLRETQLFSNNPIGVSNEIIDDNAQIIVHSGNALVFLLA